MTATMLENCGAGCTPDNQPCCCMGLHVCCTHSGTQCWFGRLPTTTIASTSMTHLLLLWDEKRSQVGCREEYMQGTHGQGAVQHKVKQRSLQHESTGACSAHEHARWCCRGCLVLWKCSSTPNDTALQAHCKIRPSRALLGGHAQHVITQLAYSKDS
jgi:hypothetical protein